MNKFLKLAVIPVAFLIVGNATSCSASPKEIALITDIGDIDDGSFNQESWEACKDFAIDNNKSYDFYRPFTDSEFARSCAIKQAVAKGAQVIILPGFKFATTCAIESKKYPNVNFLLIDSSIEQSEDNPANNVCCVGFKCEYSGFAAGYTIATDLMMRDIEDGGLKDKYGYGYCGGMASPGVYEFGFGYIQGICKATDDFCKDIKDDSSKPKIWINYNYAQVFAQSDTATATMKGWLADDTKDIRVLFPCGGKLYQSATEAVQYYNSHNVKNYNDWLKGNIEAPREAARWVGVDSDQYRGLKYDYEKSSIYTSALKGLKVAVQHALKLHYNDQWSLIGGWRKEGPTDSGGEIGLNGQWILGMNSVFGDGEVERGDYVGIPADEHDEKGVIRGFSRYTITQCEELRNNLIKEEGSIKVYGGSGTEYGSDQGIPTGMENWEKDGVKFRDEYLGSYPNIDIKYI
ncbi:MAG: BMP family ABC transporter substrate-binding protein [Bacilli bacterium]|nr:BMP family ABC transporter substrate-binding protein [Bacilli bacterium]